MVHPVAEADERSPFGPRSPEEFYAHHSVDHTTATFVNPRGLKIFTQWWTPRPPKKILGIVAAVHGFTGESSWFVQLTAVHFAKSGFATCALDHQGHGFSDGLRNHVPDINPVVDDCISFFDSFRALLIHLRGRGDPTSRPWAGIVLNGAMCGISEKFKPPWPLEHLLSLAAAVVPTWQVVPTRGSIPEVSFKVEWKRRLAVASPRRIMARPRAATAQELLRICREVQSRFDEVEAAMLIVHGGGDVVCDLACAEELYWRAASKDKTLRVYEGMWHQLVGEVDQDVELVFGEILDWLLTRAGDPIAGAGLASSS